MNVIGLLYFLILMCIDFQQFDFDEGLCAILSNLLHPNIKSSTILSVG